MLKWHLISYLYVFLQDLVNNETTTLAAATAAGEHCLHNILMLDNDNMRQNVISYLPFILLVIIPLIVFYISIQTAQLKMQEVSEKVNI